MPWAVEKGRRPFEQCPAEEVMRFAKIARGDPVYQLGAPGSKGYRTGERLGMRRRRPCGRQQGHGVEVVPERLWQL